MNGMVRTVLGDVAPADLGVTYAHEHLILDAPLVEDRFAEILLNDVDAAVTELSACAAAGVGTVVDAIPSAAGRDAVRLAEVSRQSGVHIIATTGLHTQRWYPGRSWANECEPETLAELFIADVEDGIDSFDYRGPVIVRTPHRAGVIKVGTLQAEPNDRDRRVFAAAAETHRRTGVPVLTHCEDGLGGMEQIEMLTSGGVELGNVVLSHTDKARDAAYLCDLADAGVMLELDQGLRHTIDETNPTVTGATALIEAGYVDHVMLGTDGARRSMWTALGGAPGLAALVTSLVPVLRRLGVGDEDIDTMMIHNPARFFAFAAGAQ
jgi:phosphotriesterase-related protein